VYFVRVRARLPAVLVTTNDATLHAQSLEKFVKEGALRRDAEYLVEDV
jgi:hypothetical protein